MEAYLNNMYLKNIQVLNLQNLINKIVTFPLYIPKSPIYSYYVMTFTHLVNIFWVFFEALEIKVAL